jgi:DNA-binding CsgD family transcriptional regulator
LAAFSANILEGGKPWRIAGLGAFVCLLLFASNGSAFLKTWIASGVGTTGYSSLAPLVSCLTAVVITGVAYSLRSVINPAASAKSTKVKSLTLCVAGLLCVAGTITFDTVAILGLAGYAAVGVGLTMMGINYGNWLFGLKDRDLQRVACLVCLGATILWLVMLLLIPMVQLAVICLLLTLSSAVLPEAVSPEDRERQSSPVVADATLAMQWENAALFKQNWILFVGLALSFSVQALTWQSTLLADAAFAAPDRPAITYGNIFGSLLAVVLLLWFAFRQPRNWLEMIQAIAPLACVFSISIVWVLNVWDQGPMLLGDPSGNVSFVVCNLPVGFATTMLALILFFKLAIAVRKGSLAQLANCLYIVLVSACFLLLTVIQSLLEPGSIGVFEIICRMAYLLGAAIYMVLALQRQATHVPLVTADLEGFCERFKLSKREAIIFKHVLEGRSAPGIAKAEDVAISTVKTHIKHIYEKTGVHKRDELLEMAYRQ